MRELKVEALKRKLSFRITSAVMFGFSVKNNDVGELQIQSLVHKMVNDWTIDRLVFFHI
jgi:hypothetical protein